MHDHRGGGGQPDLRYAFVGVQPVGGLADGEQPLHGVRGEEAEHEAEQGGRDAEDLAAGGLQRLREQIEADDAEHQPAREPEYQVPPVGDALGGPAAEQRHQERPQGYDHGHGCTSSPGRFGRCGPIAC